MLPKPSGMKQGKSRGKEAPGLVFIWSLTLAVNPSGDVDLLQIKAVWEIQSALDPQGRPLLSSRLLRFLPQLLQVSENCHCHLVIFPFS